MRIRLCIGRAAYHFFRTTDQWRKFILRSQNVGDDSPRRCGSRRFPLSSPMYACPWKAVRREESWKSRRRNHRAANISGAWPTASSRAVQLAWQERLIGNSRIAVFLIAVGMAYLAFGTNLLSGWWLLAPVAVFIVLLFVHENVTRDLAAGGSGDGVLPRRPRPSRRRLEGHAAVRANASLTKNIPTPPTSTFSAPARSSSCSVRPARRPARKPWRHGCCTAAPADEIRARQAGDGRVASAARPARRPCPARGRRTGRRRFRRGGRLGRRRAGADAALAALGRPRARPSDRVVSGRLVGRAVRPARSERR